MSRKKLFESFEQLGVKDGGSLEAIVDSEKEVDVGEPVQEREYYVDLFGYVNPIADQARLRRFEQLAEQEKKGKEHDFDGFGKVTPK